MSLLEKIKKNSTIKESSVLSKSKFFNEKDMVPTDVPMINVALSASLTGGLTPGLTQFCGPSKHFKTMFSLLLASSYLKKYPESILLFYDSEFGSPVKYFETLGIDMDRVLHVPIKNVEEFKFDVIKQLDAIERGEKLIVVVDSIGNLASKKEVADALEGNSAADMTRAKSIKSVFRMVTPYLNIKDIPMIVVNHVYKTQEMYSKDVVSGGTGIYLSSDNIFIIGRQQDKEGKEVVGYDFIINVDKSRYVKEKSKIPISISFEGGIQKYSGLMEVALEGGFVDKPTNGWYAKIDRETGEIGPKKRLSETNNSEFWQSILDNREFTEYVKKKYGIAYGNIMEKDQEIIQDGEENE